ncbi:EF-hand calcium-binding domain-containing protein 6-like [Engraulis encrasicolus]|uniref:EF-hand calcium-binding domain-containing protein 6-like n=1 Tax=Engraulis encrasicolus TaxID=184585 RepID=UPI002FCE742D
MCPAVSLDGRLSSACSMMLHIPTGGPERRTKSAVHSDVKNDAGCDQHWTRKDCMNGDDPGIPVRSQIPANRSSISAEKFKSLLRCAMPSLSPLKFNTLNAKVMKKDDGTIEGYYNSKRNHPSETAYQTERARSRYSMASRSIQELQQGLKYQMTGGLKGLMRTLRLYDYNRDGSIQRHELRRLLQNYLPMTDTEFKRLWMHYNPTNFAMMPYKEFLTKLGVNYERYNRFAPSKSLVIDTQASGEERGRCTRDTPGELLEAIPLADLTPEQTQEVFLKKMRQNYNEVWRTLQAFDVTSSGTLKLTDLHSIIIHFLFPMSLCTLHNILQRLGVWCTRTVQWKDFMTTVRDYVQPDSTTKRAKSNSQGSATVNSSSQGEMGEDSTKQIEGLLRARLSKSSAAVSQALCQLDRAGRGTVAQEDLRRVIQQHGLPLTDQHFHRLCEPFADSSGVGYKSLLHHLGMHAGDRGTKDRSPRPAWGARVKEVDDLLWRLRERLSLQSQALGDLFQPLTPTATAGLHETLSLADFRKILQDCKLCVSERQLESMSMMLGFKEGKASARELMANYSASLARYASVNSHQRSARVSISPKVAAVIQILSAEDCLSLMADRICEVHGSLYSAFYLMDKDRDGLVFARDYKLLHDTLGFVCKTFEYNRLLRRMGLGPNKNLNFFEFQNVVHSKGLRVQPTTGLEQLHQTMVFLATHRWRDMSKKLTRYGNEGVQIVLKSDFKDLAFSFGLPITPDELQLLWSRYDPHAKGYLTLSEFRESLKLDPADDLLQPAMDNADMAGQTWALQKDIEELVRQRECELSMALSQMEKSRGRHMGRVSMEDLLDLLQQHGCSVDREPLIRLLHSLKVSVVAGGLSWQQFLKAFDQGPKHPCQGSPRTTAAAPSLSPIEDLEPLRTESAIQRVQELVRASAETLRKVFSAFDRDGSGTVSNLLFRRVLEQFCARLTDRQYHELLGHLPLDWDTGTVCWRSFLEQLDANVMAPTPVPASTSPQPALESEVLASVRKAVSEHLLSVTMELQDADITNCGAVSKEDFREFADHHFHFLSPEQFEWLWEQLPLTEMGDLDYRTFLKHFGSEEPHPLSASSSLESPCLALALLDTSSSMEMPSTLPTRPMTTSSCSVSVKVPWRRPCSTPLLNCNATERRIQGRVHCCWREINRRCRQEDTHRTGHIGQHTFIRILKDLHINLEEEELTQLARKYDIQSNGQLSYTAFLKHFVFFLHPHTKQAFEQKQQHVEPKGSRDADKKQALSPLDDLCAEAIQRMSKHIRHCWRSMRQGFAAHDPKLHGTVPTSKFKKVLRQHGVNVSEEEFFHLACRFDKDGDERISYNDFLRTLLGSGPIPSAGASESRRLAICL